ncbi:tRNA (adenosine(37)-N6)-threonylcarbamoyltransferase complex dimerization subunit type 1 TsaB [Owenweeksia hongkongensis]|uniref:tRNA (adenosine(37)-N6)-threonylcarbamoyltransferase complex dimerization subunit type 1 TsaB n=1 Tax=Owenweeksia hongkongensis TaxID=253245 RepID=UPI003A942962
MALILSIETSTKNCSVALAENGEVISLKEETSDQYIHSEKLHLFIQECMSTAGRELKELSAVAVGKGPGSYTGLRIGVSAAKGLCYALSIPLISEDGLTILAKDLLSKNEIAKNELIMPMIDARRMEVYSTGFDAQGSALNPIEAMVIEEVTSLYSGHSKIHLLGDGSFKCKDVLSDSRYVYHNLEYPSVAALTPIAQAKFENKDFEDMAYFEPFYLKDFIAGKPKKLL